MPKFRLFEPKQSPFAADVLQEVERYYGGQGEEYFASFHYPNTSMIQYVSRLSSETKKQNLKLQRAVLNLAFCWDDKNYTCRSAPIEMYLSKMQSALSKGADPNMLSSRGLPLMFYLASIANPDREGAFHAAMTLLKHGAKLEYEGSSVFFTAIRCGRARFCEFLIDQGVKAAEIKMALNFLIENNMYPEMQRALRNSYWPDNWAVAIEEEYKDRDRMPKSDRGDTQGYRRIWLK